MRFKKFKKSGIFLLLVMVLSFLTFQFGVASKDKDKQETATEEIVAPSESFSSSERAVEEAKKYSGVTLNVLWEGGLQSQDPLTMGPKWEELTGIKINVIQIGFSDMYANLLQDHLTATGSYDVINYSPQWFIDFVNSGVIEPLNPYINKYMNTEDLEDYLPIYGAEGYGRLGDTWYGFPDDGDIFLMYYRKDLFEDPDNMAEFKAKYGYELGPPKTWQAFDDVGNFITDKYAPEIYGGGVQRSGESYDWWSGEFSGHGGQYFDPETMKPGINSKFGVQALQEIVDQNKWMPPGIEQWGFMEVLSGYMEGKIAMCITWPPIGRWAAGYGAGTEQLSWVPTSKVKDKVGYAPMPGKRTSHAGGFAITISSDSRNKEAAYLFCQWMNSPDISLERVMLPYALRDPFRISHFESSEYKNLWSNADEYLEALQDAADVGQMLLGISGAHEYLELVDKACTEAYAGGDPQAVLDKAAERWEEITERLGRENQKKSYQQWREGPWNKEGPM